MSTLQQRRTAAYVANIREIKQTLNLSHMDAIQYYKQHIDEYRQPNRKESSSQKKQRHRRSSITLLKERLSAAKKFVAACQGMSNAEEIFSLYKELT